MVNQIVFDYLKKNSNNYDLNVLKKKILSAGYTKKEVEEALSALNLETKSVSIEKPINQVRGLNSKIPSKGLHWMKIGGICGIIILVLSLIGIALSLLNVEMIKIEDPTFSITLLIVVLLVSFALFFLFYFGFVKLGGHANSKLLRYSSWGIVISYLVIVVLLMVAVILLWQVFSSLLSVMSSSMGGVMTGMAVGDLGAGFFSDFGVPTQAQNLITIFRVIGVMLLITALIYVIAHISFAVALIKTRDIKFARLAGILDLILIVLGTGFSVALYIIQKTDPMFYFKLLMDKSFIIPVQILFWVLAFFTLLFESFALFNASNKFEA